MSDITHILNAWQSEPLAMLPAKMLEVRAFLSARAAGQRTTEADIQAIEQHKRSREAALFASVQAVDVNAVRRGDGVVLAGRIGIMPVFGVLSQRVGTLERSSGGISAEELGGTLESLLADKQVRGIVMVYDSPGGSVGGIKELGDKIRAGRDKKKIVGVADPMAASAALWLIAQSSEVWVSESGQIGSHGVITSHEDVSGMEEKMGIRTTLITSSPFKAEASPFGPLSEEAKAELQSKVLHYHGMFTTALSQGRGITENKVEKTFGQGRMLTPEQAKAVGMIDRIGNLSDAVRKMGGEFSAEVAEPPVYSVEGTRTITTIETYTVAKKEEPKTLPRGAASARARALEISSR